MQFYSVTINFMDNAAIYDGFQIEQAASFFATLTFPDDLTGSAFKAQIRKSFTGADLVADFSFSIQNQSTSPGQVIMSLAPSITKNIPVKLDASTKLTPTVYVYDVFRTFPNGETDKILKGSITINPSATRFP